MTPATSAPRFRIGDAVFDPLDGTVTGSAARVALTPKQAAILERLAAAAPNLVTKQALLEEVWHGHPVSDAALTQRVKELRRMLGDDARRPHLIETVAGRGYRLLVAVQPLAVASEAVDAFTRALALADRFEWRKAADLLEQAVRLEPDLAAGWAWLAQAYLWLERPAEAAAVAARGAQVSVVAGEADRHLARATAACFRGELADAIAHLEMLLDLREDDFWAAYRLAHCYLAGGRVEESLKLRERCARLRPEHFFNVSEAGFTRLFAAGDLEGAARDYRRVLELDPEHPFALPFLMPSFQAWLAGDIDAARASLGRVLEQRLERFLPLGRVSALVHHARLRLFLGDAATALADLRRAIAHCQPGSTLAGWVALECALTRCDLGQDGCADLGRERADGTVLNRAHALLFLGREAAVRGDQARAAAAADALRSLPDEELAEFGVPTRRITERVRRVFPLLIEAEARLAAGASAAALDRFSVGIEELPLALDAPVPLATTDPRTHFAAREGFARTLAAAGRRDEAIEAESWLIEQRLQLFVTARAGVGCWIAARARRAMLLLESGERDGARSDAEEVLARWGELVPEPAAVASARAVLARLG